MFKLDNRKTRYFPVQHALKDDAGRDRKFDFDGLFEVIDQDEAEALLEADASGIVRDSKICDRVFRGWREGHVVDPEDQNLEVTESNVREFLKVVGMRGSVVRAWTKMIGLEGRLKN